MRSVLAAMLTCLACAPRPGGEAALPDPLPVIDRVVPSSGPAGVAYPVRVTIEGRHFADSGNTVTFAFVTVSDLPSTAGGTRIETYLPKEGPSPGEVPPPPLPPGAYQMTVTTSRGTSAPVRFVLTDPAGRG